MSEAQRRIITVRPGKLRGRSGWVVEEGPGVCPFYSDRQQAIEYGHFRADSGKAHLEIRDEAGTLLERVEFTGGAR